MTELAEIAGVTAITETSSSPVEVPVVEVTLLEDRASVVRRGSVELPPGRARLRIDAVAPVLVDKTLAAAFEDLEPAAVEAGVRVRDVKVERRWITRHADSSEAVAQLHERRLALQRTAEGERDRHGRLEGALADLEKTRRLTLTEIAEDVGWNRRDAGAWTRQLDGLEAEIAELRQTLTDSEHRQFELEQDLQDLQIQIAVATSTQDVARATLFVEVNNPGARSRTATLRIDYLVPGALWRPWHSARLIEPQPQPQAAPAEVELTCAGAVWQATGEDWRDVQLIFSTERPSLGVSPPLLHDDPLRIFERGSAVEVEAREQTVHTTGLGADDTPTPATDPGLPGIDDGGEAQLLRAARPATILSDGRPHRVPIFSFTSEAETAHVCVPEKQLAVILRSRQTNAAKHPLLAGPVDLIRRSGLVGRTSVLYIAPGERFELGWGPEATVRVHRAVEHLDPETKMMSSWTRKPRRVHVKLSNIGPSAIDIEVRERVAVSEIEKLEVEVIANETSRGATPGDDGFVNWDVHLPGFGREGLELRWVLVVHEDVHGL